MKQKPLFALLLSLGLGAFAHGAVYSVYTMPELPWFRLDNGSVYNGTFDLTTVGYNPATMLITNATLNVWFSDDSDSGYEYADVKVNGTMIAENLEYDGSHSGGSSTWDKHTWVLDSYASIITAVQDGVLTFSVKDKEGDGYLKEAELKVTAENQPPPPPPPPPPGVPDSGGTAAVLALGLAALFAARRNLGAK